MREWIITNGIGGYASLTYNLTNTRKFHGLLIASLYPPTERWIFVSNIGEKVRIENKIYNLQDNFKSINFDPLPTFLYTFENIEIIKRILMPYEKNSVIIIYDVKTQTPITLVCNPIINSRHFYDTTSKEFFSIEIENIPNGIRITPSNINKKLTIMLPNSRYTHSESWKEYFYQKDFERNDSYSDYNLILGNFYNNITQCTSLSLLCTIEEDVTKFDAFTTYNQEAQRKMSILQHAALPLKYKKLVLTTDQFLVKKGKEKTVIAGYHWFGEWGRDTLISLPGLTLVTKRFQDAKAILKCFTRFICKGLIPNVFSDLNSKPAYNTVDAPLWYIDRVFQYLKYTNDIDFLKEIKPTLDSIIHYYIRGTEFDIKMDNDYLINHRPGLTWMDVNINGYYPTPRAQKAVEIQALWYNALRIMGLLSQYLEKENIYTSISEKVQDNFLHQFDKFYDVLDSKDDTLRPNIIFLVSLDYSMIDKHTQKIIVEEIENNLVTVFGLRSLSPYDKNYKGVYIGKHHRDEAYHNGTVWPWLLGPFVKAFVKVKNYEPTWKKYAYDSFIKPMFDIYGDKWNGSIYEIFDGDPPYLPRGCISQAWSVAEILRALIEDIEGIIPPFKNNFLFI